MSDPIEVILAVACPACERQDRACLFDQWSCGDGRMFHVDRIRAALASRLDLVRLDPGTVEACARVADDWSTLGGYEETSARIRALVAHPVPPAPTWMKPGQRCTDSAGHSTGHKWTGDGEMSWHGVNETLRCPYVDPATAQTETTCETWCGKLYAEAAAMGGHARFTHLDRDFVFCTPACRDAGRSLNPAQAK